MIRSKEDSNGNVWKLNVVCDEGPTLKCSDLEACALYSNEGMSIEISGSKEYTHTILIPICIMLDFINACITHQGTFIR